LSDLIEKLKQLEPASDNARQVLDLSDEISLEVYPNSVRFEGERVYFIARQGRQKYLWLTPIETQRAMDFRGEIVQTASGDGALRCPLNNHNADAVRAGFDFTRPILIGTADSFGFGDRLGIANPAHLRAVVGSGMKPVLAQQSIRELERTQRSPEEVMDAATWACLQEGYTEGFGADADHLKTREDIDLMVNAGFTMFTLDPGEHVVNEADVLPIKEVKDRVSSSALALLSQSADELCAHYVDQTFKIGDDFTLEPDSDQVLRALLKYGGVIAHAEKLYHYLKNTYPHHDSEVELSVDETESVTSLFEHYLVASELKRRGVELVSLAPRFVGDFEKGIDYKGDLDLFKSEYLKHLKIAQKVGPYKISFHSGSDKFRVYEAAGELGEELVHVKTAGTSYLEALRAVAAREPVLFREILDFSREHFETEKRTYHISACLDQVPPTSDLDDGDLPALFEQDDARQVLHVTFGKVLTTRDSHGSFLFRERILSCLEEHEEVHYEYLVQHFDRHLRPFKHAPTSAQR
jgi:hypothetical protein